MNVPHATALPRLRRAFVPVPLGLQARSRRADAVSSRARWSALALDSPHGPSDEPAERSGYAASVTVERGALRLSRSTDHDITDAVEPPHAGRVPLEVLFDEHPHALDE